jgi:hypothetical protein
LQLQINQIRRFLSNAQTPDSVIAPIDSKEAFSGALAGRDVLSLPDFNLVFAEGGRLVRTEYPSATDNALNKVRGDWYEWLLGLGFWEYKNTHPNCSYFLPLPNVAQFDCARLYTDDIFQLLVDLRTKVEDASGVSLITSNPDFLICDKSLAISIVFGSGGVSSESLEKVDNAYAQATNKCTFETITGYAGAKTSLRPDRRLQMSHEGSLMKALYRHIQTRNWEISAKGIKYFGITMRHTNADRIGLRTVATHSIVNVTAEPEAAVDELFAIQSGNQLVNFFDEVLLPT